MSRLSSSEKMPWNHNELDPFLDVVVFWPWNLDVLAFWSWNPDVVCMCLHGLVFVFCKSIILIIKADIVNLCKLFCLS